ncbi:MAG: hypothetical protein AAF802_31760, partial [Planctomycetota bacterium]
VGSHPTYAIRDLVGNTLNSGQDEVFGFTLDAPMLLSQPVNQVIDEGSFTEVNVEFDDPGRVGGYQGVIDWGDGTIEPLTITTDIRDYQGIAAC